MLVSQEYPPETGRGGIGTQAHVKAHTLAARGHRVRVISRSKDGTRCEYADGSVRVTRIPPGPLALEAGTQAGDWLLYSTAVAAELARARAEQSPDLVEFPEWGNEGYVYLLNRPDWDPVPALVQLHGPLVLFAHALGWPQQDSEEYRAGTAMEGACLRLADAVYSSSACSARWCAQQYGVDAERIPVLHAGVDTRAFTPSGCRNTKRPTVVFTGRISKNKGADVLVEAACEVAATVPDLRVRMLGRGDAAFVGGLQQKASQRGFPRLLDFPGFVDRAELPAHLSDAHVFVLPSLYEPGPGLAYLEAMACGLPVIACDNAGAVEVVRPGDNGLLVPPSDHVALAEAIRRLLLDDATREEMGRAARRYAETAADTGHCIDRIESFYFAAVERGRTGSS